MDVSVIIVNYNTAGLLSQAIDSILDQTRDISYEILVVDNNSSDDSENVIPQKYGDKVIYIKLAENIGFGRANNEGIKIAGGRNVFLLNPDTVLRNNAIKILSDYLDNNAKVGVCGGNLYDEDMKPTHSYMRSFPSVWWELNFVFPKNLLFRLAYGKNIDFNRSGKPIKVAYITGADMMIRKDVLAVTGAFDPDFFMYYEETELSYRIKEKGYDIVSVPEAEIIHLEGKSFSNNDAREKRKAEARRLYYKKTNHLVSLSISNAILKINSAIRIAIFKLLNKKEKEEFWKTIFRNI